MTPRRTATEHAAGGVSALLLENVQPRRHAQGWHGGPTPLNAVRGVTAADARWVPPHGRKNIWSLVLHIAYWKYAVRRKLESGGGERFPRHPANWPRLPEPPTDAAWRADVALLRQEHERLLHAIAAIPVSRLDDRPPRSRRWTYGELIVGIAQHDSYHTGQIQMLKRLRAGME